MIGQREPSPLDPFTTCKREHFEQFAHLGRGGEHLHSRCFAQVGEGFRRRDLAQPIENAAGQEKRRLRREACDRKTRAFSRFGNRGEIDVRREIRQTGPQARAALKRDLNRQLPAIDFPMFMASLASDEVREGFAAFVEKRPPAWTRRKG